jgi:hypothetical protein
LLEPGNSKSPGVGSRISKARANIKFADNPLVALSNDFKKNHDGGFSLAMT